MIFSNYYKGEKLTQAESRFDITTSTNDYDLFELLLINKRSFNVGGHSFNLVSKPTIWKGKPGGMAITKGSHNITSVQRPDIQRSESFGDINNTSDGCIILYNSNFKEVGINTIEIFIARGLRNDKHPLWNLLTDGELQQEMEIIRNKAVTKYVTRNQD